MKIKRGNKNKKLFLIVGMIIILIAIAIAFSFSKVLTGKVIDDQKPENEQHSIGPSPEEQECI
jgi:flagellar basal body-associated protein FliL